MWILEYCSSIPTSATVMVFASVLLTKLPPSSSLAVRPLPLPLNRIASSSSSLRSSSHTRRPRYNFGLRNGIATGCNGGSSVAFDHGINIRKFRGGGRMLYSTGIYGDGGDGDDGGGGGDDGIQSTRTVGPNIDNDNDKDNDNDEDEPAGIETAVDSSESSRMRAKGQTGWNHNLPSPKSDFWSQSGSDSRNNNSNPYDGNDDDKSTVQLKTGWLHNTKSSSTKSSSTGKDKDEENQTESDPKKGGLYQARQMLRLEKIRQKRNHRILAPPTFHACGDDRRVVLTEHKISVPLDHSRAEEDTERIDVRFVVVDVVDTVEGEAFYRSSRMGLGEAEARAVNPTTVEATRNKRESGMQRRADAYREFIGMEDAEDCCLYLQGGPGFGAPTPVAGIGLGNEASWIGAAFQNGFRRIVLMDQRGTGRSTTVTKQTLQKRFPDLFALDHASTPYRADAHASTPEDIENDVRTCVERHPEPGAKFADALASATDYLGQFRADNIVMDAEAIKDYLMPVIDDEDDDDDDDGDEEDARPTPKPWGAALGQSYGGFCLMTYLSLVPHPPKLCLLTGGIAPMLTSSLPGTYASLRKRTHARAQLYYERYPGDVPVVKRIAHRLRTADPPVVLPSGGILTERRFLQLGLGLGGSPCAFASLHELLTSAFLSEEEEEELSRAFLKEVDKRQPFDDCPIYFLLHESIYADGGGGGGSTSTAAGSVGGERSSSTDWAAHSAYHRGEGSGADQSTNDDDDDDNEGPISFYGEAAFPWMADGDYAELSGRGMRSLAHRLATKSDWGNLYDAENMRKALSSSSSDDGTRGFSRAAAAVYYDDAYVDFDESMKVVERGGPLEGCKVWVTNEYQHSGLRDDGAAIFKRLLGMAKGTVGTPS